MVKFFSQFDEEEEDYQDDYSGGGGGGRKKLLQRIRKRMSIVNKRSDDDDEEDDDSYRREDDDDDEEEEQYGFLKRQLLKRQEQQEKRRQEALQQQKEKAKQLKSRSKEKNNNSKKKKQQQQELTRRRSVRRDHGEMSRFKGSRTLRLSALRDSDNEEDEDVAMPLPGHAMEDTPDLEVLLAPKDDDKDNVKRKSSISAGGKKRLLFGSLSTKRSSSGNDSSNSKNNDKSGNSSKSKSGGSSVGSRRRKKRQSSDRSVDTPPSVASTESSIDNMKPTQRKGGHPGGPKSVSRRGVPAGKNSKKLDGENGAGMEAASLDYYYLSIPWIIKTWSYFLTVVVPFTILYYCFCGIFHSSALHQNVFLQKVCVANVLFNGLGCTWRTGFWARQALDARGIHAVLPRDNQPPAPPLTSKGTGSSIKKRLPGRNRSGKSRDGRNPGSIIGNIPLPRSPTLKMPHRIRRKTIPGGADPEATVPSNNATTIAASSPDQSTSHKSLGNESTRSGVRARSSAAARRPSGRSAKRTLMTDDSDRMGESSRSQGQMEQSRLGNSSGTLVQSVWDVEHMIPFARPKSTKKRPTMDKHTSIMEIYELHAKDEKNILLQ
ncbi:expressed unknown protein [Seminavis robusta]|uniref:Uncharacterized protein n=1 Tax=Seminavis robusta TaxID=568900 RepID=A0A9N8H4R9_9STRA|nr:expressed unknown protein [Seminavis robusta]|eukprot:Sro56_g032970.1 n/a (603) ;mRNA; r:116884-118692